MSNSMWAALTAALTAGTLSFSLPADGTTDTPNLNCVQVEKSDRTWVICTDDMLDDDEVDTIIERGEAVREHILPGKGSRL